MHNLYKFIEILDILQNNYNLIKKNYLLLWVQYDNRPFYLSIFFRIKNKLIIKYYMFSYKYLFVNAYFLYPYLHVL